MPSASELGDRPVDVALDQTEGDRAELVVPGRAADEPDRPAVQLQRRARLGQGVRAAVQVQPDQPAGRPAQVVHPGDGLLAAVAALVQVDRDAEQPDLVGDGAVVGVQPDPGHAGGDPPSLERPHARPAVVRPARRDSASRGTNISWPPSESGARSGPGWSSPAGPRGPDHRVRLGPVLHLDPHHEPHPVQPLGERLRRRRARCAPRRSRRRRRRRARARCGPAATAPAW